MRIVLIGQAAFGASVLDKLLERNENVVAVYAPPEKAKGKQDALKKASVANDLPVYQPTTYKNDKTYTEFVGLNPDLVILAFVTEIVPQRYFDAATHGAICYHPSLLPRHRGASAINWALIMGDEKTGLTIFWPDAGIDTGPILLQEEVSISPNDTVGSLYFDHLFPMGVDALVVSVRRIREGTATKIPQDDTLATYEPPCNDAVANIEWSLPGQKLFNLVRGCDPQPGAFSFWKGEKIRFYEARLLSEPTALSPGQVASVNSHLQIAILGGRIQIGRLRIASGEKLSAVDFVAARDVKAGDVFTSCQ